MIHFFGCDSQMPVKSKYFLGVFILDGIFKYSVSWAGKVVSGCQLVIAVFSNIGSGVHLIKPAKLSICTRYGNVHVMVLKLWFYN